MIRNSGMAGNHGNAKQADTDGRSFAASAGIAWPAMILRYLKSERGGRVPDERIELLLNEQATAVAIRAAFDKILVRRTSRIVVFIAAHGADGYIVNYDFNAQNPSDRGVSLKEVNALISTELSGVKTTYTYVDSCNSGYLQGLNSSGLQAPEGGQLLGFAASRNKEPS